MPYNSRHMPIVRAAVDWRYTRIVGCIGEIAPPHGCCLDFVVDEAMGVSKAAGEGDAGFGASHTEVVTGLSIGLAS